MATVSIEQAIRMAGQHHQAGRFAEAERLYRLILEKRPDHPMAVCLLGMALNDLGRHLEAAAVLRHAARLAPNDPFVHNSLASAYLALKLTEDAVAEARKAIALKPDFGEAFTNLGIALHKKGQFGESNEADFQGGIAAFGQALALMPGSVTAWCNYGSVLLKIGDHAGTIAAYRKSIRIDPGFLAARAALIYAAHFHPDFNATMLLEETRQYAEIVERPLAGTIAPHSNDRTSGRRLKIGYVSPDFRRHPVARFLLPLVKHHDREAVEVYCYSSVTAPDDVTDQFKQLDVRFIEVAGLNDAELAERIRADRIDILLDLTQHMPGCRLGVFARKPAPVQAAWLGYIGTTGLKAMDYRLTDGWIDPPGEFDGEYSEKPIRLAHSYWCYEPYIEEIEVAPLPAVANGFVTFGCFNGFLKVTEPALQCWAELLAALPDARMEIHSPPADHRKKVLAIFSRAGVEAERINFVENKPVVEYLQGYHRVDIALDPFPYGGGTTTCDAAWMGVPTVTLRGRTGVGRGGVSILSNLGLPDWIAGDIEEYKSIATRMAGDLARLNELRRNLRQRMRNSPLMDAKSFSSDFEAALRGMWVSWAVQ